MTAKREKSPRLKDKDRHRRNAAGERKWGEIPVTFLNVFKCVIRDKTQIDVEQNISHRPTGKQGKSPNTYEIDCFKGFTCTVSYPLFLETSYFSSRLSSGISELLPPAGARGEGGVTACVWYIEPLSSLFAHLTHYASHYFNAHPRLRPRLCRELLSPGLQNPCKNDKMNASTTFRPSSNRGSRGHIMRCVSLRPLVTQAIGSQL